MFDNYEGFKKDVLALTKIDLNYYKEKQMRRRIDTLATKNGRVTRNIRRCSAAMQKSSSSL